MKFSLLFNRILIFSFFALVLSGCGIHQTKPNQALGKTNITALINDPNAQITYAEINQAIIQPNCISCHNASQTKGGISLESYTQLTAHLLVVKGDIDHLSMPKDGALSSEQIALFDKWVDQGNPEFAHPVTSSPSPTPAATPIDPNLRITFADVNREIIQPSCITCHNATVAKGTVVLENFADVKAYLVSVTNDIGDGSMPDKGTLTPNQKTIFNQWISQGATEFGTAPNDTPTPAPTPLPTPNETAALTAIRANFELLVKPLVKRACMDCHDSAATPEGLGRLPIVRSVEWGHIKRASKLLDFTQPFPNWSLASTSPVYYLTQLRGVIQNKTMSPKYYKIFHELDGKVLKAKENQVILDWIDQSMKILDSVSTSVPTAQDFLKNNCLGCHNSDLQSGGFSFQKSGTDLTIPSGNASDGTPYLTAHDPNHSAIYLVLSKGQMPLGGKATAQQQQLIFDWIEQGR